MAWLPGPLRYERPFDAPQGRTSESAGLHAESPKEGPRTEPSAGKQPGDLSQSAVKMSRVVARYPTPRERHEVCV